ncbi:MAG: hypothetical protein RLZZ336_1098 [Cyanobacteriota bacterium]
MPRFHARPGRWRWIRTEFPCFALKPVRGAGNLFLPRASRWNTAPLSRRTSSVSAWRIDTDVWLALSVQNHPGHGRAHSAFLAATPERPWLWCRATQQRLLRLVSTPAITRVNAAWMALAMLLARPQVTVVDEPPGVMALDGCLSGCGRHRRRLAIPDPGSGLSGFLPRRSSVRTPRWSLIRPGPPSRLPPCRPGWLAGGW